MKTKQDAVSVVIAELERSLSEMESNYRKAVSNLATLRERVETDDLTRLLRRDAFMNKLQNLLQSSKAEGKEVCLMMIDIDHFKKVNDTYGHQSGDAVIERVSALVRQYLRPQDLAGRYGGEEIIVAVQASRSEAISIAENIRKGVASSPMVSTTSVEFQVTLSVGLASTQEFKWEAGHLISKADEALYRAKRTGRNKVISATALELVVLDVETAQAA